MSVGLTYNTSIGKIPDATDAFMNSETQMANYSAVYARARDSANRPIPNAKIMVSGRDAAVATDQDGGALISNIQPYEKIILNVEPADDLSLVPDWTEKKLVLRPGTVRPVDIPFQRRGGIEGKITGLRRGGAYRAALLPSDNHDGAMPLQQLDSDGAFIFDDVPYGNYILMVKDQDGRTISRTGILINNRFKSMEPIEIEEK
jgi:hypothetical protein